MELKSFRSQTYLWSVISVVSLAEIIWVIMGPRNLGASVLPLLVIADVFVLVTIFNLKWREYSAINKILLTLGFTLMLLSNNFSFLPGPIVQIIEPLLGNSTTDPFITTAFVTTIMSGYLLFLDRKIFVFLLPQILWAAEGLFIIYILGHLQLW